MSEKALDGVKVIECCAFVAGPYCTKLMADLGAEVIKIEPPGVGDEARRRGPFLHDTPNPDLSGLFLYLNTNKLGITLNLETATGRNIFKQLTASVDILVEDRAPGEMERLGLGYETLKKANSHLIMTSITPFGQTGPYRNYKAYYLNTYHASGAGYLLPSSSANLEREPIKGPGMLGEYDAGLSAAMATMGALYWRDINSLGQHIDVSKQQALMALDKIELARFQSEGKSPNRGPRPGTPVQRFIRSKDDGYLLAHTGQDNQWQGLVVAMGNPEWAKDERFKTEEGRRQYAAEIRDRISEWAKELTTEEIFHKVQTNQCPAAPVNSVSELLNSPQIQSREFLVDVDHPVAGSLKYPSWPYHFSETPGMIERPAPLLGQHNEEVFCHRLGYTKEDMVKLEEAEVI